MKVYISSESPVKHAAVEAAFAKLGVAIETIAEPTQSGVSEQPLSLQETHEGAQNRHSRLVSAIGDKAAGGYLITIESGLDKPLPERNYYGVEVVIVEKDGEPPRVGIGYDIEFPKEMTDRVPSEYADLGILVKTEYGAETKDPYPFFTNGKITRQALVERTLADVLVQFDSLVGAND